MKEGARCERCFGWGGSDALWGIIISCVFWLFFSCSGFFFRCNKGHLPTVFCAQRVFREVGGKSSGKMLLMGPFEDAKAPAWGKWKDLQDSKV